MYCWAARRLSFLEDIPLHLAGLIGRVFSSRIRSCPFHARLRRLLRLPCATSALPDDRDGSAEALGGLGTPVRGRGWANGARFAALVAVCGRLTSALQRLRGIVKHACGVGPVS